MRTFLIFLILLSTINIASASISIVDNIYLVDSKITIQAIQNATNFTTYNSTDNPSNTLQFWISDSRIRFSANTNKTISGISYSSDTWAFTGTGTDGYLNISVRMLNVNTPYDFKIDNIITDSENTDNNGDVSFNYTWSGTSHNFQITGKPDYNMSVYNTGWQTIFVNDTMTMSQIKNMMNTSNVKFVSDWIETSSQFNVYWPTSTYRQNQQVNKGQAVWIKFTNNDTVTRNKTSGSYNWTVKSGWNMLGNSYNGVRTLAQINTSINNGKTCDNGVDQIIYTNLSTQAEYKFSCGEVTNGNIQVLQGEGFWANSNSDYDIERMW